LNIQDYISTGILESYVLGLVSEEEKKQVEAFMHQYPEISAEVKAIEEAFAAMAHAQQAAPPAHLKEAVMASIINRPVAGSTPGHAKEKPTSTPALPATGMMVSLQRWQIAAAAILLLVSLGINALLYLRWQTTKQQYASLLFEKEILAQQMQVNEAQFDLAEKELTWLRQPGLQVVSMQATGADPQAQATVYWQPTSEEVYLAVHYLPAPPQGKQYQLWVIKDGTPVDAGMIAPEQLSNRYLHAMKGTTTAQAFAITLEQAGGSPTPTMEAMYVMGKV
jgi:anti-sigma-K factor RskA